MMHVALIQHRYCSKEPTTEDWFETCQREQEIPLVSCVTESSCLEFIRMSVRYTEQVSTVSRVSF